MQIGDITKYLEMMAVALNDRFFAGELPMDKVAITVQSSPSSYAHITVVPVWENQSDCFYEINLSAEHLSRPCPELCSSIIHEFCHFWGLLNSVKTTSRMGYYHNARFKEIAEKHGVIIGYDPKIGYSPTSPSMELFEFVQEKGWKDIDLQRSNSILIKKGGSAGTAGGKDGADGEGGERKKKSNQRKYQCPNCKCSCRATKPIRIKCLDCDMEMVEVKKEEK